MKKRSVSIKQFTTIRYIISLFVKMINTHSQSQKLPLVKQTWTGLTIEASDRKKEKGRQCVSDHVMSHLCPFFVVDRTSLTLLLTNQLYKNTRAGSTEKHFKSPACLVYDAVNFLLFVAVQRTVCPFTEPLWSHCCWLQLPFGRHQ